MADYYRLVFLSARNHFALAFRRSFHSASSIFYLRGFARLSILFAFIESVRSVTLIFTIDRYHTFEDVIALIYSLERF